MAAKKPMHPGCLIVLIILGIVVAFHLAVFIYFFQAKFKIKEIKTENATAESAEASAVISSESAPPLVLAKEALATSANGKFIHDKTMVLDGFYMPAKPIQAGHFRLAHIAIGASSELLKFEKEGQTIPTWTPFMFSFEDMTSKELQGETGPYRENSPRVFCKSYRITRDVISFEGYDKQVGKVAFIGKIDPAFMADQSDPKRNTSSTDYAVLTGDLTVGDKVFKGVSFSYFVGD